MNEEQETKINKIIDVLNCGIVSKFFSETDNEKKDLFSQKINDTVGFDLIGHADFLNLYNSFDSMIRQKHSIAEGQRNYEYLLKRGSLVTDWSAHLQKSQNELIRLETNFNSALNSIASSTLGKTI